MTNEQIKRLLASDYIVEDVRLRPDLSLAATSGRDMGTGFLLTYDEPGDLWAIRGLVNTTYVEAADITSLRFSKFEKRTTAEAA